MKRLLLLLLLTLLAVAQEGSEEVRLSFVGDIDPWLLQSVSAATRARLARATEDCDAAFGNLECALTDHPTPLASKAGAAVLAGPTQVAPKARDYLLKAPPAYAPLLKEAGFSILSLANNHSMDYGPSGLHDTLAALDEAGLDYCGAGPDLGKARAPRFLELNGTRVAFVAYSEIAPLGSKATATAPGIAWIAYPPGRSEVVGSIRNAREAGADLVIVSLHWGKENSTEVEPYQRIFARHLIDSGADAIIGHHPHVLRAVESYRGKTIAYSLGNYLFSKGTSRTLLLKLTFQGDAQRAEPRYLRCRGGIPQTS